MKGSGVGGGSAILGISLSEKVVFNWSPLSWGTLGALSLYGLAYTFLLLVAAHLIFRRKSI